VVTTTDDATLLWNAETGGCIDVLRAQVDLGSISPGGHAVAVRMVEGAPGKRTAEENDLRGIALIVDLDLGEHLMVLHADARINVTKRC
jgi:hypothetical protein